MKFRSIWKFLCNFYYNSEGNLQNLVFLGEEFFAAGKFNWIQFILFSPVPAILQMEGIPFLRTARQKRRIRQVPPFAYRCQPDKYFPIFTNLQEFSPPIPSLTIASPLKQQRFIIFNQNFSIFSWCESVCEKTSFLEKRESAIYNSFLFCVISFGIVWETN